MQLSAIRGVIKTNGEIDMPVWHMGYVGISVLWISIVLLRTFIGPDAGSWADWMAAFGTVGALIGSIYIATTEARNRK